MAVEAEGAAGAVAGAVDMDEDGALRLSEEEALEAMFAGEEQKEEEEEAVEAEDDEQPDPNLEAMLAALGPSVGADVEGHRAGFVSIVGSPNVGKSTLMNTLLGEQLSITTPKASTTRQRIMGIANEPGWQIVYSDTPGVVKPSYKLHEGMMGAVRCAIEDADVLLLITDVLEGGFRDERMLQRVKDAAVPVLVLINKVDLIAKRQAAVAAGKQPPPLPRAPPVQAQPARGGWEGAEADDDEEAEPGPPRPAALDLPALREWWSAQLPAAEIFEVSALEGDNMEALKERLLELLPEHPPYFDKSQLSDRPEKFFAAEFVRAQIFEQYEDEIPYSCEVEVTAFKEAENKVVCEATVHVMRDSQKGILIGNKATKVKQLTEASQRALYRFFGKRFDLRLQVKVSKDWRANDSMLRQFGYLR